MIDRNSVIIVDIRLIVDFIHGVIEDWFINYLQMALKFPNYNHEVNFNACKIIFSILGFVKLSKLT
jgi:hypothetical protein